MRTRPGQAEPEVYFRIVHFAQVGQNGAPVAANSEQTVEIAQGPKGAFENGNIGALTQRVPIDIEIWPASCYATANGISGYPNATRLAAVRRPGTGLLPSSPSASTFEVCGDSGLHTPSHRAYADGERLPEEAGGARGYFLSGRSTSVESVAVASILQ